MQALISVGDQAERRGAEVADSCDVPKTCWTLSTLKHRNNPSSSGGALGGSGRRRLPGRDPGG